MNAPTSPTWVLVEVPTSTTSDSHSPQSGACWYQQAPVPASTYLSHSPRRNPREHSSPSRVLPNAGPNTGTESSHSGQLSPPPRCRHPRELSSCAASVHETLRAPRGTHSPNALDAKSRHPRELSSCAAQWSMGRSRHPRGLSSCAAPAHSMNFSPSPLTPHQRSIHEGPVHAITWSLVVGKSRHPPGPFQKVQEFTGAALIRRRCR